MIGLLNGTKRTSGESGAPAFDPKRTSINTPNDT
jgi:hypothetical protein